MRHLLAGARLFTGEQILDRHALVIENRRIVDLVPLDGTLPDGERVDLPADALLVPGFIDLQVNGAGGRLFNATPTIEAALAIAKTLRRFGTTGVLPTFLSDEPAGMRQAGEAALAAATLPSSGVLGVHLEGPFISKERKGCHDSRFIRQPSEADLALTESLTNQLAAMGGRVLMTLAPECVDDSAIARLAAAGTVVAAGHTAASYERVRQAVQHGVTGFTHLSNGMPPVANRDPGPVVAGLDSADAWCGVIADGIHVHPGLLRVMIAAKRPGKIFLVTDAMPPVGTEATAFDLHGRTILRRDGRLMTADGILAGADIDMASTVRNCVTLLGLPLEEALRMASLYPASFLRLDHRFGRLSPGYQADLALLDPGLAVLGCWVGGEVTWFGGTDRTTDR